MDLLELEQTIELYEAYEPLLTEKQKTYFKSYYYDDLSLAEIAEINKVSRNAVFDQIKKTNKNLMEYESKLKLLQKTQKLRSFKEKLSTDLQNELESIIEED